ncbi:CGNR zinc finger domain-containing protein [Branchiibius sp. NY16-3462-2]|uniref:CGNR zinc finger domain-containing protein n=1 Tax=Branchiibius sp. NY16-3462-2 TaxID=1807500 RepID=UPI00079A7E30|nr:CGNR zinc finger domain-containing protein [Branchiibius sp. NY16-3462-2]KYH46267.1 RNA-binding protein [Branchiibius sp. NY16-3462-2]
MAFGYDTDMALRAAAALANSEHADPDALSTVDDLADFVRTWGWTGTVLGTPAEVAAVRGVRAQVRSLWAPDEDTAVARVNALLEQANAVPQLVKHDEYDWHLHATPSDAPLATRMVVEAAMAVVDVIRDGEFDRLRVCAADDCDDVLIDLTKNRSRRFCDAGCGNRLNVAAFRARQAGN